MHITPETFIWELEERHPELDRVLRWHGLTGTSGLARLRLFELAQLYPISLHVLLRELRATAPEPASPLDRGTPGGEAAPLGYHIEDPGCEESHAL